MNPVKTKSMCFQQGSLRAFMVLTFESIKARQLHYTFGVVNCYGRYINDIEDISKLN